jgi:murein DD-endopeptidase MepM/ murein hydrolase activator NlpD
LAVFAACLGGAAVASADLQERLDRTQERLDAAQDRQGVLTSEVEELNSRIGVLEQQVADLRAQEAAAEAELAAKQAELDEALADLSEAHDRLEILRARLERALGELSDRLVAIYEAGSPDLVSVLLSSDGFDDLVQRSAYLEAIQEQNENVVDRVRDLRDQMQRTVAKLRAAKETIEEARDIIAAKEAEIASARAGVESQEAELESVRAERQAALDEVNSHVDRLEENESDLQNKIQQQIAEATLGVPALPAGTPGAPSSAGFIWPVNGILTSGFGYRWGSMHEGIDIAVPEGTPILAAASGTVILAGYTGGYGNYTCIDHGSGLSTCYGHQSGYAVSSGSSVTQGQVIGYSGNTGSSTGPHLHFEVRINGAAVDPLGYL